MAPDTAERSLATVRRFMAATGAERRNERRSLLHDDFVVHEAGGLPFSGDYHGSQGFFELLNRMNDVLELTAGPISTDPLGDNAVAARFRLTFISRASGKSVEMATCRDLHGAGRANRGTRRVLQGPGGGRCTTGDLRCPPR